MVFLRSGLGIARAGAGRISPFLTRRNALIGAGVGGIAGAGFGLGSLTTQERLELGLPRKRRKKTACWYKKETMRLQAKNAYQRAKLKYC